MLLPLVFRPGLRRGTMGVSHRWDGERGILLIEMIGVPTDAELLALAEGVAGNPEYPTPRRELVDLRGVETTEVSSTTLRRVTEVFQAADRNPAQSRIAIVAETNLAYGLSRVYQALRSRSPLRLEVFRDYEEALAWLTGE